MRGRAPVTLAQGRTRPSAIRHLEAPRWLCGSQAGLVTPFPERGYWGLSSLPSSGKPGMGTARSSPSILKIRISWLCQVLAVARGTFCGTWDLQSCGMWGLVP